MNKTASLPPFKGALQIRLRKYNTSLLSQGASKQFAVLIKLQLTDFWLVNGWVIHKPVLLKSNCQRSNGYSISRAPEKRYNCLDSLFLLFEPIFLTALLFNSVRWLSRLTLRVVTRVPRLTEHKFQRIWKSQPQTWAMCNLKMRYGCCTRTTILWNILSHLFAKSITYACLSSVYSPQMYLWNP